MFVWLCKLRIWIAGLLAMASLGISSASSIPPRVVTLTPHATEMVYAAGGGELIVATINASDYPEDAKNLPRLGDGIHTSLEEILRWKPDLVVGWPSLHMERLSALGISTFVTNPTSVEEIIRDIEQLGQLLGTPERARTSAFSIRSQSDAIKAEETKESISDAPIRVIVLAGADGHFVIGADPLINSVIAHCGGTNPFADSLLLAPQVGLESIISTKPALIVSGAMPAATIKAVAPVRLINPDWLYRPGPRFVMAARQLCEMIRSIEHEAGIARPD